MLNLWKRTIENDEIMFKKMLSSDGQWAISDICLHRHVHQAHKDGTFEPAASQPYHSLPKIPTKIR